MTGSLDWRRKDGFILHRPKINFVADKPEQHLIRLYTSEGREENGYFILKVRTRTYETREDGTLLVLLSEGFVEEFYKEHPGKGWKFVGIGMDGKIVDPAIPS